VTLRKTTKKKLGRKTRYLKRFDTVAYQMCLLGATDEQMAEAFDVSEQTINTWKQKHPTFLESIKKGKMPADAEIAHSLFQRARGYVHPETKVFQYEGDIITYDVYKIYPPDTAACIIWLKNRQKLIWRDKHDHNLNASEELLSVLDIIDGKTKGKLPDASEVEEAG